MSDHDDLRTSAVTIIDANPYMTLATADATGRPWASPVWYASVDYREFFWVSSPAARHSSNIAARHEIAIVIFDSQQAVGTGRAVYLSAVADQVPDHDLDRGIAVFSQASQAQAAPAWTRADVEGPARHRLYRATALEHFLLSATDERFPVDFA